MKKIILLFSLLIIVFTSNAQSEASCATAKVFTSYTSCINSNSLTGTEMWFKFTAETNDRKILLKGNLAANKRVDTLQFYSGTCGGLQLVNYINRNPSYPNDSLLQLTEYFLTIGTTYYIRASRANAGSTAVFDLCLSERDDPNSCIPGGPNIIPTPTCELICNGDFETSSGCISWHSETNKIPCWNKYEFDPVYYPDLYVCYEPYIGSTDYYNSNFCPFTGCSYPAPNMSVPNNWIGSEASHISGQGYGGIYTYYKVNLSNNNWVDQLDPGYNYREYFQQELSHPLVVGQQYTFTMYVSLAENSAVGTYIGAVFNVGPLDNFTGNPFVLTPQVESATPIIQTSGWTPITLTFTATTAATWVIIGNFKPDALGNMNTSFNPNQTSTEIMCNQAPINIKAGYYYIDDVSLKPTNLPPLPTTVDYFVPAKGTSSSVLFPGTTVTNKNISVQGTLTVDNNMVFSGCNFVMDPDVKINQTTGNLTLNSQTHLYGCAMWDGIYVNTKTLTTTGSAFIEDAKQAVNIAQGGYASILQTIFNKNLIALEFSANTNGTSPLSLRSSIITSRNIPFTVTTSTNSSYSDVITNITGGAPWASSNLKYPYTDRRGCYGVDAFDVNLLNVGLGLGNQMNYFDNIMCGVNLVRSNGVVYNNTFQNLVGYNTPNCPSPPARCYYEAGIGVKTNGTAGTGANYITVGDVTSNKPNFFKNTFGAMYLQYTKTHTIKGNNISNTSTGPFPVGYGNTGITVIYPTADNVINISNQALIKNCANAIYVNRASSTGTASLTINNNGDALNAPTVPCITADANGYCTNGIFISDIMQGTVVPSVWEIKNNVISEAATCINLLNVKKPASAPSNFPYNIIQNSVTTRYATTGNRNGIKAQNCFWLSIVSNHTKYNSTAGTISGGNLLAYGIYLQNSTYMSVRCNQIDNAARSMVFHGSCGTGAFAPGTIGIEQNHMYKAQDGFVLLTNGIIGTQGTPLYVSDNYWDGVSTDFSRSKTYTDGTFNANFNSKLYFSDIGLVPVAATNKTSGVAGDEYSLTGGGLYVVPNYTIINHCGQNITPAIIGNTSMADRADPVVAADTAGYRVFLKTIAEDTTKFATYSDETHWMRKKFVFDELKTKPSLNTTTPLQKFYSDKNNNYSKFAQVEDRMLNKQYSIANSINNSIAPANLLESNQQTINTFILQPLLNKEYVYTANDAKTINAIALQCPFSGGYAVYQARNMMMGIENRVIVFDDNCDQKASRSIETALDEQNNAIANFKLYPNPNDGNMTLEYSINKGDKGTVRIYSLEGKLIAEYLLTINAKQLQINNNDFNNGIYIYHVIVNDKTIKSDKLVIIKQ